MEREGLARYTGNDHWELTELGKQLYHHFR
jgi:hypothetical protein